MKRYIFLFLTFFACIIFAKLLGLFFLQDEWAIYGNYIFWEKAQLSWFARLFIYEQETHLIPLSNIVSYWQYSVFGLRFIYYAICAIGIHIVNAYLVYLLGVLVIRRSWVAILASILFLVNSVSHQAFTWIATTIGTAGATTFALLSLLFLGRYMQAKPHSYRLLALSLLAFVVSLGFKEISIFLFIFLPFFAVFVSTKKERVSRLVIALFVVGCLYGLSRIVISNYWTTTAATPGELSQPALPVYAYRLVANPVRLAVDSIIPQQALLSISRIILLLGYPQLSQGGAADPYLIESVGVDIVTFGIAILGSVFVILLFRLIPKGKKEQTQRVLLLSLAFILASSIPFIIIPGRAGYITLFDGRHLYMTNIFSSIALATIFSSFIELKRAKNIFFIGGILIVLLYCGYHIRLIRGDLRSQEATAGVRRSILTHITASYPSLPTRVIFYIESDKAYYGLPPQEAIVPFQSGFGQTLLVWYNAQGENFPSCFFERKFLYPLLTQGYKECSGRGFGYYRTLTSLKSALKENNIESDQIIAFRFSSITNTIENITEEIRSKTVSQL